MENDRWTARTLAAEAFPAAVRKDPGRALLAFDFDGTLAHMNPDPEAVSLVEESASALEQLTGLGVDLALISGRPVDTLVRLGRLQERPAFSQATILGQYGIERLDLATGERRIPPIPVEIDRARPELAQLVADHPGAYLEDKGRALAVHVRRMPDPEAAQAALSEPVHQLAERHGLQVEPGRLVWEVRAASADKGDALRELIRQHQPRAVLMAGDDLGDLAAFAALAEAAKRGIYTCALVSDSQEQPELRRYADVLCDGPDGVAAWLQHLVSNLR